MPEHVLQEALLWPYPKRNDKAASKVRRGHGHAVSDPFGAAYANQNFIKAHRRLAGRAR